MKLIVWMRHDLRVRDNPALLGALKDADAVIPMVVLERFCDDREQWSLPRRRHYASMVAGLSAELERRDCGLVVRHGDPLFELVRVLEYAQADGVYFCRHNDPRAMADELRVYNKLVAMGFAVRSFEQGFLPCTGSSCGPQRQTLCRMEPLLAGMDCDTETRAPANTQRLPISR